MMDELDRKLVSELQSKGVDEISALASILEVGEQTIRRRIARLKSKGIIRMVVIPNPKLAGYTAWAKIGLTVTHRSRNSVTRQLIDYSSIYFVAHTLGIFDIMIGVHFSTLERLEYFVNSELSKIKGIIHTEAMLCSYPRKYYNLSWPAPVFEKGKNEWQNHMKMIPGQIVPRLDERDRRILAIVEQEGIACPAAMKARVGLGETMIRKRIKAMFINGILRMEAVPNPRMLVYELWATMGITINNQFAHKVLDEIIQKPAVYLAAACLGRFNLIIGVRFDNVDAMNQFVNIELPKMEGIGSVETFLHTRPLKYHNIDWFHES